MAFKSTHAALSFEATFGEQGSLVPVPPKVRAGCGMALRFFAAEDAEAKRRVGKCSAELGVGSQMDGLFRKQESRYYPLDGV